MRILYVTPNFGTGGTEKMILDLATNMQDGGFWSMVCSIHDGILGGELVKKNVRYEYLVSGPSSNSRLVRVLKLVSRVFRLRSIIKAERVDVVHAHHLSALNLSYYATRWTKARVVYTEHSRPDKIYSPVSLRSGCFLARNADHCTGVSPEITEFMVSSMGVRPRKASTILNGIDIKQFNGTTLRDVRAELGFSLDDPVVGCIGNLRKEKNQQQIVAAFSAVVRVYPTARLLLVGGGVFLDPLKAKVRELGLDNNVVFLGPRLDAPDLMAIMDVYCLTSTFEGLPLTVLEAMASGIPVVATDVTGIRDVVRHGENGLLVPLDDPQRTAEAILHLIENRIYGNQLAQKGKALVTEKYSLDFMIRQYRHLYCELTGSETISDRRSC